MIDGGAGEDSRPGHHQRWGGRELAPPLTALPSRKHKLYTLPASIERKWYDTQNRHTLAYDHIIVMCTNGGKTACVDRCRLLQAQCCKTRGGRNDMGVMSLQ
jgi:hypothetical protein